LTPHRSSNRIPVPGLSGRRPLLAWAALLTLVVLAIPGAPAQTGFNRDLIVLDPAHGGANMGAQIADHVLEKDITLAMALRLRSLLAARGFTVVLTRDGDAALSTDQRAELANRAHAVACLVLHASASGSGVHLATSTLNNVTPNPGAPVRWDEAQAAFLTQSERLADQIATALNRSQLPLVVDRAALRPLDNLQCPALAVELAPLTSGVSGGGSDATPVTDPGYQQRVGEAIAGALILWRTQARPPVMAPARGASTAVQDGQPAGATP